MSSPLELSGAEMRELVSRALDRILPYVESLGEQPAAVIEGGPELARSLAEALPEDGTPVDELLDLLFERALSVTFNSAGPGYLAYIPGGGLLHSGVADLIADAVNRYTGVWLAAPGLVQLEVNVLRWFCDILGYPPEAGGFLTSGGSLANLTAIVTARREGLPEEFLRGTLYTSDQTHHSVRKAAVLAGFPARNLREIPSDDTFRLRLDALEETIAEDRRKGFQPFFVAANAGTTNSGAVDPLDGIAELAIRESLWFHVDAAYGGFFALTDRGRQTLQGLGRADSVTLDPHKGLFLPFGTGCLLVRDLRTLQRAHHVSADYMPALQDDPEFVDFCEISPELSRDYRGLRVWLPLKIHGFDVFRRQLDEKLDLARYAADALRRIPGIEIVADPQLSLLAFRLVPPGLDDEALDRLNRELLQRINRRQRVFLTPTTLHGRFVIRICVLSFRTHRERVDMALDDIRGAVAEVEGLAASPHVPLRGSEDPCNQRKAG